MKNIHCLFILVSLMLSNPSSAQDDPFNSVQELFAAISAVDHDKMAELVTSDFQLLEVGEVWDIHELVEAVGVVEAGRRNFFHVVRSTVSGNTAWVSYWNKATFPDGEEVRIVAWLESAILVRDGLSWKVQMLHSTKIEPEKVPAVTGLTEYKN